MKKKIALIFGITGQDGSYLASYLLKKKYKLIGISRKRKQINKHIILGIENKIKIKYINYYNEEQIKNLIIKSNCNEIYFFGGQPIPSISNELSLETLNSNIIPVFYVLNTIFKYKKNIKFFNASSCEIFKSSKFSLNENSKKEPNTIYGLSKLISFELVKFFREKFNLKVCSGIMFQHESVLRKKDFVIKKIITKEKKIKLGKKKKLYLGNLNVIKDWGWAPEYVQAIHKIVQENRLDDFIIATGKSVKLKDLAKKIFLKYDLNPEKYIRTNKKLFRKHEILISKSNINKIKRIINWKPKFFINEIISKLVNEKLH